MDGTLLEAWASHKSSKPKDALKDSPPSAGGRNAEVDIRGQKRSNETHRSTTDPEARLARKSNGTPARMCFAGHLLIENGNALIVDAELTGATGHAERDAAVEMLGRLPKTKRRRTVAADKGYDTPASSPKLGVFGSMPAFDTFFKGGFRIVKVDARNLAAIGGFYRAYAPSIDQHRPRTLDSVTGRPTRRRYTRAKVIDMIFLIEGGGS